MSQKLFCPEGHEWQSNASSARRCPQCGREAIDLVAPTGVFTTPLEDHLSSSLANAPTEIHTDQPPDQVSPHRRESELPMVSGFELLAELGRGGMGVVYKARQLDLNRLVALKMILGGSHAGQRERDRFRREAESVAALSHPNIVQIFHIGEADSVPYLALEFVEGGSLAEQLHGTPQRPRAAAELAETLARAVAYAHERGIVHRDLKPGNVLLPKKQGHHPKIADFGLAKRLPTESSEEEGHSSTQRTRTGAVLGTPSYLAPEQAEGRNEDIGPSADIYALGAILYECLTGRPPFTGTTPLDTLFHVLHNDPISPRRLQPKIPKDLETICLKCLRKEPERRYLSAQELADDLHRFRQGAPIQARPLSLWRRGLKQARRRPAVALSILIASVAILSLLGVSLWFNVALQQAAANQKREAHAARSAEALAEQRRQEALAALAQAEEQQREAERQAKLAHKEFERSRRSLYALQLAQVANLVESDPGRARELLDDHRRCPLNLRDFTWALLRQRTQRQVLELNGHANLVSSVAFSPDGQLLASASWDRTARIWDAADGEGLAILEGHEGIVLSVAFSADGRTLATAGDDCTVRLWRLPDDVVARNANAADKPVTIQPWQTLRGHPDCVRCVAFSPDGSTLASGGSDGTVILWSVSDQARERQRLPIHRGIVWTLAFSPNGKTLATGGNDQSVFLWDWTTSKKPSLMFGGYPGPVTALAFSPQGTRLGVVSHGESVPIHIWDLLEHQHIRQLHGHTRSVFTISFSPNGEMLASGGEDACVCLWDTAGWRLGTTLKGHTAAVRSIAFSPDHQTLASGGRDHTVRVWRTVSESHATLQLHPDRVPTRMALSHDGRTIAMGNERGDIEVWRDEAGMLKRVARPPGHTGVVLGLAISADGRLVVSGGDDQLVRIWDERNNANSRKFTLPGPVRAVTLSEDDSLLAVGGRGFLRIWRTGSWEPVEIGTPLSGTLRALAFSPDHRLLACAVGRNLELWQVGARQPLITLVLAHMDEISAVAFDADSSTVMTGDSEGIVNLWDLQWLSEGERKVALSKRAMLSGHVDWITAIDMTPDGRSVITASRDRTIRTWDPVAGQERGTLSAHNDGILAMRFLGNGENASLLSLSRDGGLKLWKGSR